MRFRNAKLLTKLSVSRPCSLQILYSRVSVLASDCALCAGHSVSFTPTMITWRLPQRIDPLMSSGRVQLLEVYLGINGQRLDPTQMPAKLSADDSYIIVQIPVGADGGYFKVKGSCFYKKSRFVSSIY